MYSTLFQRLFIALSLSLFTTQIVFAAPKSKRISVKLGESGITDVDLLANNGETLPGETIGDSIVFSVKSKLLNGATLLGFKNGQLVGPVGRVKGNSFLTRLKSSAKDKKNSSITLKPRLIDSPYVEVTSKKGKLFSSKGAVELSSLRSLGFNVSENILSSTENLRKVKISKLSGGAKDSDSDGFPDSYDVDGDGDGILDIADSEVTEASSIGDTEVALPFTTLFLDIRKTVNWHVTGDLAEDDINEVIGGENLFSIAFFFNFPDDGPSGELANEIAGGYIACPDDLLYCRSPQAGESSAVYSGFSESDSSLIGQTWSALTASGEPNSLERLNISGGGITWAGAIQPRVGPSDFRPGDSYRADFVNSSGAVIARRALTLPPYFLTVPALRSYNTTSSDRESGTLIDYGDENAPGTSQGNPIVLETDGDFAGKLLLDIWRLQRAAVTGSEFGEYRDFGHLNYGIIINNNSGEFTCGGLYESLSSTLSELPSTGEGGGFQSNQGALLWPLVDSADDYAPSNSSEEILNNTISFVVDLTACRERNGLNAGPHQLTITAAGADTGNGANRAAQLVWVDIP